MEFDGEWQMSSLELTAAITALANALACKLTPNEAALLAAMLVQLGDTLSTISATQALCKERAENAQNADEQSWESSSAFFLIYRFLIGI